MHVSNQVFLDNQNIEFIFLMISTEFIILGEHPD